MECFPRTFELTLPNSDDLPAEFAKFAGMFPIIGNIALKLFLPPLRSGFRDSGTFTPLMPMPETAVNKNNGFVFRQDDVRFARQVFDVFSESVTGAVQHGAHQHLGLGIFALDLRHIPASLFRCQVVGHFLLFPLCMVCIMFEKGTPAWINGT